MKKIIIPSFIILSISLNFSFASEDKVLGGILENKNYVVKEFKSFFKFEKSNTNKDVVLNRTESETESKKDLRLEGKVATTTTLLVAEQLCENKIKILNKKEKVSANLKNQIKDKNKLTDKLLEISSEMSPSSKEIFEEKILKLETEVSNAIKIQKDILNILASSTDSVCDSVTVPVSLDVKTKRSDSVSTKENKDYSNLNKTVKKLELENDKQLEKINKFIKTDIKNLLVETNKEE